MISVPAPRLLAGMVMEYPPLAESAVAGDVNDPAVRIKVPVGVAPPEGELATVPVTVKGAEASVVAEAGVTVTETGAVPPAEAGTAAQALTTLATFSEPRPVARSKPVPAL
jgi:hypothetical protein